MWTPWILLGTATLLVARYEALIDGVTPQQVLDLLNSVRASVVPTAAQMVALTWDAKLASVAASYATTQCSGHMGGGGPSCPDCMNWMGDAENPSYGTHGILDAITGVFLPEVRSRWMVADVPALSYKGAESDMVVYEDGCDVDLHVQQRFLLRRLERDR